MIYPQITHSIMCNLAKQNSKSNSVNPSKGRNCNVFFQMHERFGANFGHAVPCCGETIAEQAAYAQTTDLTFIANEMFLPRELDYHNYDFITVLRDPWQRYISHYAHEYPDRKSIMKEVTEFFGQNLKVKKLDEVKNFKDWVESQRDNYTAISKITDCNLHIPPDIIF